MNKYQTLCIIVSYVNEAILYGRLKLLLPVTLFVSINKYCKYRQLHINNDY